MKNLLIIFAIIFSCSALYPLTPGDQAIIDRLDISKYYLSNSHFGTDFWVTFHQTWGFYDSEYRIFVVSLKNTSVTIELPGGTNKMTKLVKAKEPTVFTSKKSEINISWSGSESETVTSNGLHVYSDEPILVYVYISSKDYAGEGYMALPTSYWGTEYFNFSYYDYKYPGNNMFHPGGFIVIASEEKTRVKIELKGSGKGLAKTKKGANIGDVMSVDLTPGQTYSVTGDAKTNGGLFDLTGTRITANKPIAVVSFHEFSCITHLCDNFGNYFSEMLLPTSAWGKKYYSVMFTRTGSYGDYFRVIGAKDATDWKCRYFDKVTNKTLGNLSSGLKTAGDFFEWYQGGCGTIPSIRGLAIWESDKPFMVMQYAYSHMWDGDLTMQPVMIHLTSEAQYLNPVTFLAPGDFPSELDLFAVGDTADKSNALLKSIMIDGEPLINKAPAIVYNNIPETNIYWVKLTVDVGVHTITGNTKFAGYLARFRPASYGWYMGMGLNKTDEIDSLPPQITKTGSCGNYTVEASEVRNAKPFPEQKDQGISRIIPLTELSSNYIFALENPAAFRPQLKITKQKFTYTVIDRSKSAKAYFAVLDRAGNMTLDSVSYEADNLTISSPALDFGKIRVKNSKNLEFSIKNSNPSDLNISTAFVPDNFTIENIDSVLSIPAGDSINLTVKYEPSVETDAVEDLDTIVFKTECNTYSVTFSGHGVAPKIAVQDYDFGTVEKGFPKTVESLNNNGFVITNPGSDSLIVFAIDSIEAPFELSAVTEPALPFKLAPKQAVALKSVVFNPQDSGLFSRDIIVRSDGMEGDSVSSLSGRGKIKIIGVEEQFNAYPLDIQIKPNPAESAIRIEMTLQKPEMLEIQIFDLNSKLIGYEFSGFADAGLFAREISLDFLPSGIYIIIISCPDFSRSIKIEVAR